MKLYTQGMSCLFALSFLRPYFPLVLATEYYKLATHTITEDISTENITFRRTDNTTPLQAFQTHKNIPVSQASTPLELERQYPVPEHWTASKRHLPSISHQTVAAVPVALGKEQIMKSAHDDSASGSLSIGHEKLHRLIVNLNNGGMLQISVGDAVLGDFCKAVWQTNAAPKAFYGLDLTLTRGGGNITIPISQAQAYLACSDLQEVGHDNNGKPTSMTGLQISGSARGTATATRMSASGTQSASSANHTIEISLSDNFESTAVIARSSKMIRSSMVISTTLSYSEDFTKPSQPGAACTVSPSHSKTRFEHSGPEYKTGTTSMHSIFSAEISASSQQDAGFASTTLMKPLKPILETELPIQTILEEPPTNTGVHTESPKEAKSDRSPSSSTYIGLKQTPITSGRAQENGYTATLTGTNIDFSSWISAYLASYTGRYTLTKSSPYPSVTSSVSVNWAGRRVGRRNFAPHPYSTKKSITPSSVQDETNGKQKEQVAVHTQIHQQEEPSHMPLTKKMEPLQADKKNFSINRKHDGRFGNYSDDFTAGDDMNASTKHKTSTCSTLLAGKDTNRRGISPLAFKTTQHGNSSSPSSLSLASRKHTKIQTHNSVTATITTIIYLYPSSLVHFIQESGRASSSSSEPAMHTRSI